MLFIARRDTGHWENLVLYFKESKKVEIIVNKGGPQIGLSAVIGSPRSPKSTHRVHTFTIESLLHDLHVIFGIFKIGGH